MARGALKRRYVGPNEWLDEWLERLGEPWAHCAIRDSGSFSSRDSGAAALQSCLIRFLQLKFEALPGRVPAHLGSGARAAGAKPPRRKFERFQGQNRDF